MRRGGRILDLPCAVNEDEEKVTASTNSEWAHRRAFQGNTRCQSEELALCYTPNDIPPSSEGLTLCYNIYNSVVFSRHTNKTNRSRLHDAPNRRRLTQHVLVACIHKNEPPHVGGEQRPQLFDGGDGGQPVRALVSARAEKFSRVNERQGGASFISLYLEARKACRVRRMMDAQQYQHVRRSQQINGRTSAGGNANTEVALS